MPKEPSQSPKKKLSDNSFIKYSNIAFQLAAAIFIGVFAGIKADAYFNTKPLFTVVLSLFGIGAGFYISLKDFFNKKD